MNFDDASIFGKITEVLRRPPHGTKVMINSQSYSEDKKRSQTRVGRNRGTKHHADRAPVAYRTQYPNGAP